MTPLVVKYKQSKMKTEQSNQQDNISMGIDVMAGDDSRNNNDDDKGNEDTTTSKRRYVIPRSIFATYMIMSVMYTIWFIIELIRDGNQSDWHFYIPGLMEQVALELIVLIVLLLSILGYWPQHTMKCCVRNCADDILMLERIRMVLYYVSVILGLVAAIMYFWLYVPLQSSFIVWLVRWIPWAAVSLVAFFIPCCVQSSDQHPVMERDEEKEEGEETKTKMVHPENHDKAETPVSEA
jgi:uncharacterized protein YacL